MIDDLDYRLARLSPLPFCSASPSIHHHAGPPLLGCLARLVAEKGWLRRDGREETVPLAAAVAAECLPLRQASGMNEAARWTRLVCVVQYNLYFAYESNRYLSASI